MNRSVIFLIIGILVAFVSLTFLYNQKKSDEEMFESIERGQVFYNSKCALCHQENGEGVPGLYPPLRENFCLLDKNKSIDILLYGLSGTNIVNGLPYNEVMHPVMGTDQQLSDVLNFASQAFCNAKPIFTADEVKRRRGRKPMQSNQ